MKREYFSGLRAGIPVMLGFIPVGIAYGIMARQAGLSLPQTCGMSLTVFAGAAQMMASGMVAQGAGLLSIIVATFFLNLRHIIMSTCVGARMRGGSPVTRLIAAFGVTDESFAIYTTMDPRHCTVPFFFGVITMTYGSWNAGSLLGALAADFLPPIVTASFAVALYAMFLALLLPGLRKNGRLLLLVLLTAAVNWLFNQFLPQSWSMICSTLLCAFLGVFFVDLPEGKEDGHDKS